MVGTDFLDLREILDAMEYRVGMVIQDYRDYPAGTVQMELMVSQVNRLIIRTYVIFSIPIHYRQFSPPIGHEIIYVTIGNSQL